MNGKNLGRVSAIHILGEPILNAPAFVSLRSRLSKLLSQKGRLVSETIDPLQRSLDWSSWSSSQLLLSYLTVRDDGAELASRLLDQGPEDSRDGLFFSCYWLKSTAINRKLSAKFLEGSAEGWSP